MMDLGQQCVTPDKIQDAWDTLREAKDEGARIAVVRGEEAQSLADLLLITRGAKGVPISNVMVYRASDRSAAATLFDVNACAVVVIVLRPGELDGLLSLMASGWHGVVGSPPH